MAVKRWWFSLFPPPRDEVEAEIRAHAIGAFLALAAFATAIVVFIVWLVTR